MQKTMWKKLCDLQERFAALHFEVAIDRRYYPGRSYLVHVQLGPDDTEHCLHGEAPTLDGAIEQLLKAHAENFRELQKALEDA